MDRRAPLLPSPRIAQVTITTSSRSARRSVTRTRIWRPRPGGALPALGAGATPDPSPWRPTGHLDSRAAAGRKPLAGAFSDLDDRSSFAHFPPGQLVFG